MHVSRARFTCHAVEQRAGLGQDGPFFLVQRRVDRGGQPFVTMRGIRAQYLHSRALKLDSLAEDIRDPLLKNGVEMIVDSYDPEYIRDTLLMDVHIRDARCITRPRCGNPPVATHRPSASSVRSSACCM